MDTRCLAFLIGKNMTNGVVLKPEFLSTVGYRSLNGLDGRFERPDENVFVIFYAGIDEMWSFMGNLDLLLVCEGVFGDGCENQVPSCIWFANVWTRKLDQIFTNEFVVPRFKTRFSS